MVLKGKSVLLVIFGNPLQNSLQIALILLHRATGIVDVEHVTERKVKNDDWHINKTLFS